MTEKPSSRGQTEPIAAIVSVAAFVVGLGLYAVFLGGALPGTSDVATADTTVDRVWADIETDGVFHAHEDADDLYDLVTGDALPAGATVYVSVTAIDDREEGIVAEAGFPSGYPNDASRAGGEEVVVDVREHGPPDDASIATRSIPVAVSNEAEVRAGTLRVAVW